MISLVFFELLRYRGVAVFSKGHTNSISFEVRLVSCRRGNGVNDKHDRSSGSDMLDSVATHECGYYEYLLVEVLKDFSQ